MNKYDEYGTPLPAPIDPVEYVPGQNPQQQMGILNGRVNECIRRWNEVQRNCYEAMNKAVGACVSNNVYYQPDEVTFCSGYNETEQEPYEYVVVKPKDRAGRPIQVRLATAYNDTANSDRRQNIQDVSFLLNANVIMTAVNPEYTGWQGTAMQHGCPINTTALTGHYVVGFDKHGDMKIFNSDVDTSVLYMNKMVDVIGPVTPIIMDGAITGEAQAMTTKGSITAIGWKAETHERIFFSAGANQSDGMTGATCAAIMQEMDCTNAVITAHIVEPEGIDNNIENNATNGMEFLGKFSNPPLDWESPYNVAYWFVNKRPEPGWKNKFEGEIADLVQLYGRCWNDLTALQIVDVNAVDERIKSIEDRMDALETELTEKINQAIADLEASIAEMEAKISQLETDLRQTIEDAIASMETQINNFIVEADNAYVKKTGDTMSGVLYMGASITSRNQIKNIADGEDSADAVTISQMGDYMMPSYWRKNESAFLSYGAWDCTNQNTANALARGRYLMRSSLTTSSGPIVYINPAFNGTMVCIYGGSTGFGVQQLSTGQYPLIYYGSDNTESLAVYSDRELDLELAVPMSNNGTSIGNGGMITPSRKGTVRVQSSEMGLLYISNASGGNYYIYPCIIFVPAILYTGANPF